MIKKSIIAISVAAVFTATSVTAVPVVPGSVLSIDAGSKFNMGGSTLYTVGCAGYGTALTGFKGLYVGSNMGDIGAGSHGGSPNGSEGGGSATAPWLFLSNTGYDFLSEVTGNDFSADSNGTVDMSAWTVSWNGIPEIPMGVEDVVSSISCTSGTNTCADGESYTIIHKATVPIDDPSGFGSVRYDVCLQGTVTGPGSLPANTVAPVANDVSYISASGLAGNIFAVTKNDIDIEINDAPHKASIDLDPATPGQQTTVTTALGGTATLSGLVVLYDAPVLAAKAVDTFQYTVDDWRGPLTSNIATVTIAVGNTPPVCNDDGIAEGALFILGVDTSITIDVLANDIDADAPSNDIYPATTTQTSPGGINSGFTANGGTLTNNADGTFTYVPAVLAADIDIFTYNVSDDDTNPRTCADATVSILIADVGPPVSGIDMGYLVLAPGNVGTDNKIKPALGEGSWFSMELTSGVQTHTAVSGFNHIQLGTTQPALSPGVPNIDEPWLFFGNLGVHQTTSDMKQLSNMGGVATLDFSGWNVSWNAIPSIPLGTGAINPVDDGIATLQCYNTEADFLAGIPSIGAGQTCDDGDLFLLTYTATVPDGDISGFGGVPYAVHFEGTISDSLHVASCDPGDALVDVYDVTTVNAIGNCITKTPMTIEPGATAIASGNTTGLYLTPAEVGSADPLINPNNGQQCIGGCLDFVINNVPVGGEVNLVVRLLEEIPVGAIYRKLINGKWVTFDTGGDDLIGSGPLNAGNCGNPKNTSFSIGLREGNRCLFMKITDGGPNDADGVANGTIVDPSGIALAGSPNDADGDGIPDAFDNCPSNFNTRQTDTDSDGVGNACDAFPLNPDETTDSDGDRVGDNSDNCTVVANPSQCDGDSDGYGNHCDADFNNDGIVNRYDLKPLLATQGSANPITDLNCNGIVNQQDIGLLKYSWGSSPGPSALVP